MITSRYRAAGYLCSYVPRNHEERVKGAYTSFASGFFDDVL
jgi:hypothetical protein